MIGKHVVPDHVDLTPSSSSTRRFLTDHVRGAWDMNPDLPNAHRNSLLSGDTWDYYMAYRVFNLLTKSP